MRFRFICILAACLSGSAFANLVEIEWAGDGGFGYEASLAAGDSAEVCGDLTETDVVKWMFTSSGQVDFNIHYHQDKDVIFPEKATGISGMADRLEVSVTQAYCWMFTNNAEIPTTIELDLQLNPH